MMKISGKLWVSLKGRFTKSSLAAYECFTFNTKDRTRLCEVIGFFS